MGVFVDDGSCIAASAEDGQDVGVSDLTKEIHLRVIGVG